MILILRKQNKDFTKKGWTRLKKSSWQLTPGEEEMKFDGSYLDTSLMRINLGRSKKLQDETDLEKKKSYMLL